jgi:hypothetical protein
MFQNIWKKQIQNILKPSFFWYSLILITIRLRLYYPHQWVSLPSVFSLIPPANYRYEAHASKLLPRCIHRQCTLRTVCVTIRPLAYNLYGIPRTIEDHHILLSITQLFPNTACIRPQYRPAVLSATPDYQVMCMMQPNNAAKWAEVPFRHLDEWVFTRQCSWNLHRR